ncbi:fibulin-1-like isoform X2 [Myxocyprinus asiaticus]|uniref:fibulin-1-like isoform X2 n=1 Tax=Myxocyprinus asiaticus TaxID=70543 RepID=UPI0022237322|nr:fibulin-1-like isoform X2 [Myxocyprinus asiaticus]
MGPFFIMLFSLCGVLQAQETKALISLDNCCKDGKQRGLESQDCTSLPLISESTTCRIAQEQCCAAVLEDNTCTNGINMAKDQGSCHALLSGSTCETKTAKMCCECCLLGRAAQEQDLSCDLSLPVGYQCGLVSRRCCLDRSPDSDAKYTEVVDKTSQGAIPSAGDQCKAANCAHSCVGNGTCVCFEGYKFKADGKTCEDINECLLGSHHCRTGERCINTMGSYRCQREVSCGTGYELTENNKCEDIDECETGTHNCAPELQCQNTVGSFRCRPKVQCGAGFIQDALGSCIDINECLSVTGPCQPGQMCFNTVGSYTCQRNTVNCGRGYHLNAEGTRCIDIDECAGPDNTCDGHGCINMMGSYRCECRSGYMFNSINRLCEDINECRNYPGRLCAHKCENVLGSYQCSCSTGFKLANDGRNCNDLNECETKPCSQECANVYGSYQCYCRRGYQLSDVDGITCEDIDECALPTGGHICLYRCHNTLGSFHCTCPVTGYRLAPNGRSCQDIDECVTGTHTCTESESCFNIQGGFKCLTFDCPANYTRSEETPRVNRADIIRCVKSCQPNDISCVLNPVLSVSHTAISLTTFREFTKPEEIVFLRSPTPSHSLHMDSPEIIFDILEGNVQNSFDIIKRLDHGMVVGVVRQVKLLAGPFSTILKLAINYVTNGVVSHRNIINVHIYVSEFWF